MPKIGFFLVLFFVFTPYLQAQGDRIFLLDQGLSLVEQRRVVVLKKGINKIIFSPLPEGMVKESIYPQLKGCRFLEQSFSSPSSLTWKVNSKIDGQEELKVTYLTKGINWKISYQMEIDEKERYFNLFAWLSLENKTDMSFSSVKLAFVRERIFQSQVKKEGDLSSPGNPSKKVNLNPLVQSNTRIDVKGEDIIYYLNMPVELEKNQAKTFLIFSLLNVPVSKVYLFDGEKYGDEVREEISFKNLFDSNLNFFLPAGKIYIFRDISEGEKLFVGTQDLPQVPPDAQSFIYLRSARGITGRRIQTFYKEVQLGPVEKNIYKKEVAREYGYQLIFFNSRATPVVIKVVEHLYGFWEILESNPQNYREMRDRIIYELNVPPHTEKIIKYRARII